MEIPVLQLASWQVWLLGAVASFIVWFVTWLVEYVWPKWFKKPLNVGRFIKTILVIIFAGLLAWWWYPVALPAFPILAGLPDFGSRLSLFMAWVSTMITTLLPFFGSATAVYNLLLSYITDGVRRANAVSTITAWATNTKAVIQKPTPPK
jgi:MFS superfamily sulfate permease-like transporter